MGEQRRWARQPGSYEQAPRPSDCHRQNDGETLPLPTQSLTKSGGFTGGRVRTVLEKSSRTHLRSRRLDLFMSSAPACDERTGFHQPGDRVRCLWRMIMFF